MLFNHLDPVFDADSVSGAFARLACDSIIAKRPALIIDDATITYRELGERITALARGLLASGVTRGDVVGILAGRTTECVAALLAAMAAGGAACVLDQRLPPHELALRAATARSGWLRTGELGRLDSDGYLTVTGRLKEIIIRGGENLAPGQIEAALLAHPAVKACCVVGAPHADLGEVPVAFVVAHEGQRIQTQELLDTAARVLPRACTPQRVELLDSLPEIGVGKIDRKALRTLAAELK